MLDDILAWLYDYSLGVALRRLTDVLVNSFCTHHVYEFSAGPSFLFFSSSPYQQAHITVLDAVLHEFGHMSWLS